MQDLIADAAGEPAGRGAGAAPGGELAHRPGRRAQPHQARSWTWWASCRTTAWPGPLTGFVSSPTLPFGGGYGSALEQVLARDYPTYGIGLQVTLPIHNRIAEADLARDELQVKQSQIRAKQLQNQAALEVEDALIAMRRARASYEAAVAGAPSTSRNRSKPSRPSSKWEPPRRSS